MTDDDGLVAYKEAKPGSAAGEPWVFRSVSAMDGVFVASVPDGVAHGNEGEAEKVGGKVILDMRTVPPQALHFNEKEWVAAKRAIAEGLLHNQA